MYLFKTIHCCWTPSCTGTSKPGSQLGENQRITLIAAELICSIVAEDQRSCLFSASRNIGENYLKAENSQFSLPFLSLLSSLLLPSYFTEPQQLLCSLEDLTWHWWEALSLISTETDLQPRRRPPAVCPRDFCSLFGHCVEQEVQSITHSFGCPDLHVSALLSWEQRSLQSRKARSCVFLAMVTARAAYSFITPKQWRLEGVWALLWARLLVAESRAGWKDLLCSTELSPAQAQPSSDSPGPQAGNGDEKNSIYVVAKPTGLPACPFPSLPSPCHPGS